jgi:hypothetical protein
MSMKKSFLIRIMLLLALLTGTFAATAPAYAMEGAAPFLPAQIVIRSTTFWDATFNGTVNADRIEQWSLQLEDTSSFSVTVTALSGDLIPSIYFLNSSEVEISSVVGVSSETVLTFVDLPAGDYYVRVQPASGGGTYGMTIRQTDAPVVDPDAAIVLDPAIVDVGESSTATVFLNNIPAEGYASAEFSCTYDPLMVEVSNITQLGLFGTDPAVVIHGPLNGSFIFAIAGSNGQRAMLDGAAFNFTVTGLQVGEATIICDVRASTGNSLVDLGSNQITLTIAEPQGVVEGTVLASKPVTVTLYNLDTTVAGTTTTDESGYFSLTAPAGSYTIVASAVGFLKAQGSPTVTSGATTTMETVSLLAGDIDGNDVIDEFDAMTIGINYGLADPDAADLNNDGVIDVLDLEMLAANYREAGALNWQ